MKIRREQHVRHVEGQSEMNLLFNHCTMRILRSPGYVSTAESASGGKGGLSKGGIFGIVIAAVVTAAVVGLLLTRGEILSF